MAGKSQDARTVEGVLFAFMEESGTLAGIVVVGRFARSMESRNIHV
jgi:hypothetical protein